MTLPKNITDAIDAYRDRIRDGSFILAGDARAALEAAIAELVEPPTDAEVEAWAKEVFSLSIDGGTICAGTPSDVGTENEAFVVHRGELEAGLALMRRARATGSLERLRERVEAAHARAETPPRIVAMFDVLRWIDEERGAGR